MLGQFDAEDYRRDEEEQAVANGEPEAILWIKKKKKKQFTFCMTKYFQLRKRSVNFGTFLYHTAQVLIKVLCEDALQVTGNR